MRIDLHLHTSASDGQFTPTELIQLTRKVPLDTIAITDHDTIDGIEEAIREASQTGMPLVIPGVELSAEDASGDVHMLGYFIDIENPILQTHLAKFQIDRATRAKQIVEKLTAIGKPIEWERVLEISAGGGRTGGVIGRPHVARAMIEAGYVNSIPDAFNRYLNPNKPAYVARERLTPEGAIALIHSAGGAAVLAHPSKLANYDALVRRLVPAGLDGVEVVHPANFESVRLNLRGLARQFDLVMTGGSDFHGVDDRGWMSMGAFMPPDGCVQHLRARAERYRQN